MMKPTTLRWLLLSLGLVCAPLHAQGAPSMTTAIRLYETGEPAQARATLLALAKAEPRNALVAYHVGRAYFVERNFGKAAEWFGKAGALEPQSSLYAHWQGRAHGQEALDANKLKQALLARKIKSELERAVRLDPDNAEARYDLMQFYQAAPGAVGGSKQKAQAQLAEIRQRSPWWGYVAQARMYLIADNDAALEKAYLDAIRTWPDSLHPQYGLGTHYQATEQWDKAFELYERMLKKYPNETQLLYQFGRAGAHSGQRLERAEQSLRAYLERPWREGNPTAEQAHYRLGLIYEKQGDRARAREAFQEALKLRPGYRDAKAALARVK